MIFKYNNLIRFIFLILTLTIFSILVYVYNSSDKIILSLSKNIIENNSKYNVQIEKCDFSFTNGVFFKNLLVTDGQEEIALLSNINIEIDLFSFLFKGNKKIENLFFSDIYIYLDNFKNRNESNLIENFSIKNIDANNIFIIKGENTYQLNSNMNISAYNNLIKVSIDSLEIKDYPSKKISILSKNSFLSFNKDSINFNLNDFMINDISISSNGFIARNKESFNVNIAKTEVLNLNKISNEYILKNLKGQLNIENQNLLFKSQSFFESKLFDGLINIDFEKNKNDLKLSSIIQDSKNQIKLLANFDSKNNIWKINSKVMNYLFTFGDFNTNVSGNIDFYGKSLDLVNAEIMLNIKEQSNQFNFENIKGKINYNNGELYSLGELKIEDENFYINIKDFYMNDEILKFKSKINFNDYLISNKKLSDFDSTYINGYAVIDFNKINEIYYFKGQSNLNNVKQFDNKFEIIDISYDGMYKNGSFNYNLNSNISNVSNNYFPIDSIFFNLNKNDDNYLFDKIKISTNETNCLELSNLIFNNNGISLDSLYGDIIGSNFYSSFINIQNHNNNYDLDSIKLIIDKGSIMLDGSYLNKNKYNLSLDVKNFNINNFNKILNSPQRLDGITNAKININYFNNSAHSNFSIYNGQLDEIPFDDFSGVISYRDNMLLLSNVNFNSDFGKFNLDGWLTSKEILQNNTIFNKDDSLYIKYNFNNLDLNKFNRYFPISKQIGGLLTTQGKVQGKIENISFYMDTEIVNPEFEKLKGEKINGELVFKDSQLYLKGFNFLNINEIYTISGSFPLDIGLLDKKNNLDSMPLNLMITGKSQNFNILTSNISNVDYLIGDISLQLSIGGTYSNPLRNGQLVIRNAELSLLNLDNLIQNINAVAILKNNRLIIEEFNGHTISYNYNKSIFEKSSDLVKKIFYIDNEDREENSINLYGIIDLTSFFKPDYSLSLKSDNIFIKDTEENFIGNGNLDFTITGRDTVEVLGTFKPKQNMFTIVSDFSSNSVDEIKDNKMPFYRYDIEIPLQDGIKVENSLMDLYLDGYLNITEYDNEGFKYSGELNIIEGSFFYNGNEFTNLEGSVYLEPTIFNPELDVFGTTNIAGENIDVSFFGSLNQPNLVLESLNNYSQSDIIELLLFRDNSNENLTSNEQIENFISNYFENELERNISKYTFLNKFQLNTSGTLLSGIEDRNLDLYVGANISPKLFMNYKRDVFSNVNEAEYEFGYRMNRNMSIVAKIDENRLMNLNYRIRYHYK